jgi:hypothetical protein
MSFESVLAGTSSTGSFGELKIPPHPKRFMAQIRSGSAFGIS